MKAEHHPAMYYALNRETGARSQLAESSTKLYPASFNAAMSPRRHSLLLLFNSFFPHLPDFDFDINILSVLTRNLHMLEVIHNIDKSV